ncbi:MAG: hypothetical protein AAF333_13310 [Planctomycetota bacterium]
MADRRLQAVQNSSAAGGLGWTPGSAGGDPWRCIVLTVSRISWCSLPPGAAESCFSM